MKKAFLLIVLPALLVALGFAQTPAASGDTGQTNIQGCLGGSDGNYTVAEDNTGQIFKVTTSSVDLKPHLGHDVKLIGHKTTGAVGSGAADNSLAVTEVNMISEHCAPAVAAAAAALGIPPEAIVAAAAPASAPVAPVETVSTTAAVATPPVEAVVTPAATATPPAETVVAPAPVTTPPAETVVAPAPVTAPPAETVGTPAAVAAPAAETVVTPVAVAATHPTPSARPRKRSATSSAAPAPAESVSTPVAAAAPPAAPVSTTSETASTPAPPATTTAVTHKSGSLWLIPAVVLLLIFGTMVPLVNRWRKRKLLEQTSGENLSLTQEAIPVVGKSKDKTDKLEVRKAA